MAFKKCTSVVAWSKGRQNLESIRLTVYEKQYFTPVLTCSNLCKPFHTCLQMFTPVHNCSHLFTPVHTCSHLFTPQWLSTCPNLSGPARICPRYSDDVRSSRNFLHFRMLLFFSLTSYPGEIAYFNSPNRELSKDVLVMELYRSKIVDPSRSPCLKTVDGKSFECRNFLVLRPVLLKDAYFSSANRQLSNDVWLVGLR